MVARLKCKTSLVQAPATEESCSPQGSQKQKAEEPGREMHRQVLPQGLPVTKPHLLPAGSKLW